MAESAAAMPVSKLDATRRQIETAVALYFNLDLTIVSDGIEGWYNPHRRHSALDYQSPINDERSQLSAA